MKTTLILALTLTAGSAFAQQPAAPATKAPTAQVDARFAAWLGCWRLDDDLSGTGARMCITPDKGGVRLQTVVGTQRGIDELVIPDGVARPISDSECTGTERSEWSKDGARIFRNTVVTCGKETPRTVQSVAFLSTGPSWVNVQHVSGKLSNESVNVQRYRRAFNQKLADGTDAPQPDANLTARTTPEVTTWDIDDVIEGSSKVPVAVMQAALTEVHHPFDLSKKTLITLADSGVDSEVIDLMVALTYPSKFVVRRAGGDSSAVGVSMGSGWFDPFMSPMLMGAMANCYTPAAMGTAATTACAGTGTRLTPIPTTTPTGITATTTTATTIRRPPAAEASAPLTHRPWAASSTGAATRRFAIVMRSRHLARAAAATAAATPAAAAAAAHRPAAIRAARRAAGPAVAAAVAVIPVRASPFRRAAGSSAVLLESGLTPVRAGVPFQGLRAS